MISSPAPPQPTDPAKTAAAQAGMNRDTAIAQQQTNMTNQVTPQGNLSYNKLGEDYSYVDSKGKTVTIPRYEAVTSYSPEQQALYDTSLATQQKIGQIGLQQSGKIGDLLGTPINLNNESVEARLTELGSKRIDPRFAREEDQLRTRLANQGIGAGSAAYNDAFTQHSQTKNDAYNQLYLTGRGQAVQEALTERNQPIQEVNALLTGSQVSQPNFVTTPQAPVAGVDYVGAVNNYDNNRLQAWNMQNQQQGAKMGGIFGMIGSGISMFSDRRLKENIKTVGKLNDGTKLYSYNYKGNDAPQVGVMAQEAEKKHPEAVGESQGYKTVDYSKILEGQ